LIKNNKDTKKIQINYKLIVSDKYIKNILINLI